MLPKPASGERVRYCTQRSQGLLAPLSTCAQLLQGQHCVCESCGEVGDSESYARRACSETHLLHKGQQEVFAGCM
jgi:hypothetical protein